MRTLLIRAIFTRSCGGGASITSARHHLLAPPSMPWRQPSSPVPASPGFSCRKFAALAVNRMLSESREFDVVYEGPVNLEEHTPWRSRLVSHDWTANSKWRERHLTLLRDGTLCCSPHSRVHVAAASSPGSAMSVSSEPNSAGSSSASGPRRQGFDWRGLSAVPHDAHPPLSTPRSASGAGSPSDRSHSTPPSGKVHATPSRLSTSQATPVLPSPGRSGGEGSPGSVSSRDKPATPAERATLRIPLQGALCVRCTAGVAYGRRPHAFLLQTRSRDYYFACTSVEQADEWVQCLTSAIGMHDRTKEGQPAATPSPSLSLRSPSPSRLSLRPSLPHVQ